MLVAGFKNYVNFGIKWALGFGSDNYIRVKVITTLGLGFRWRLRFKDGEYFRVRSKG
jgi:hypothetical protein